MAIDVTEEMRAAVYADDCGRLGHVPNFRNVFGQSWGSFMEIGGPDDATLPHVTCERCGQVWLLLPQPYSTYQAAVADVQGRVKDAELVKPRPRKPPRARSGAGGGQ